MADLRHWRELARWLQLQVQARHRVLNGVETMSQRTTEQASQQASGKRSMLDRAVIISVLAMAGMNVVILAQQMQISPLTVAAGKAIGATFV
jgi:hypothetical protein